MAVRSCCSMQCVNRIHPNTHNVWSTVFCNTLNTLFVFIWALKTSFNIVNTVLSKLRTRYGKDKLQQLLTNFKPVHTLYNSVVLICSLPSYLMWDCLGKNCCAHCSCSCQNCSYLYRSTVSLQLLKWWFEKGNESYHILLTTSRSLFPEEHYVKFSCIWQFLVAYSTVISFWVYVCVFEFQRRMKFFFFVNFNSKILVCRMVQCIWWYFQYLIPFNTE
jgi:hypothetical protein